MPGSPAEISISPASPSRGTTNVKRINKKNRKGGAGSELVPFPSEGDSDGNGTSNDGHLQGDPEDDGGLAYSPLCMPRPRRKTHQGLGSQSTSSSDSEDSMISAALMRYSSEDNMLSEK
eukprot:gene1003-biopygen9414